MQNESSVPGMITATSLLLGVILVVLLATTGAFHPQDTISILIGR